MSQLGIAVVETVQLTANTYRTVNCIIHQWTSTKPPKLNEIIL